MQKRLTVNAGPHDRAQCPVSFALEETPSSARLVEADSSKEIACQLADGRVCWVVDRIPAGGKKAYVLDDGSPAAASGTTVTEQGDRIDVSLGDRLFATYRHGGDLVRPFLNPVIGPTGTSVLRELFEPDGSKEHDHIHHRGILVAHGDVNGTDNWSESKQHGRQVHLRTEAARSGPVFGTIATANDWVSNAGEHVLYENREITFWNVRKDVRIIDFVITFDADAQDVVFGDTKEGGILSVRVATPLRGDRGGTMVSAVGGVGEKECWGKRAHWCDCGGVLEGKKVGVAVFDAAGNFRHPTYWHIRNYGLFAANPFGLSYYYKDKSRNGSHTLPKGSTFTFGYRVYLHAGDAREGGVAEAYHNYANPPEVTEEKQ